MSMLPAAALPTQGLSLCILENDDLDPPISQRYTRVAAMFERLFAQAGFQGRIDSFSARHGQYPDNFAAYDAVLLTGSRADAFSDEAWVVALRGRVHPDPRRLCELRRVRWFNETGQPGQALPLAKELVKKNEGQVPPLVELVHAAHAAGSLEERDTAFTKLRELAARADRQVPPLARLQPIAAGLGWGSDWRLDDPEAVAVSGERPDLETLGPLCWHPPLAQSWRLGDADGRDHSDKDFAGKPYLLIFFLGRECLHCMEQLNAFAPKAEQFTGAGLPIVAVSTDSVEGLRQTLQTVDESEQAFPFPLVSDQSGDIFRRFRAWDDFEETALHGTFLIDGDGRVRWQHISFEPFMEVDFLLQEATRLLQFPAAALPTDETFTDVGQSLDAS
jgi:peroxiredoxin